MLFNFPIWKKTSSCSSLLSVC